MKVLSLFDGMSCGQIALERAGFSVEEYYASEIDKYAITVTTRNYPDTIQLGDIKDVDFESLPEIDLVLAGSPCQGFSIAGNKLNFNDSRSALFFNFVEVLKIVKPKYFLFENVAMKQQWADVITKFLGVEPIKINSRVVSALNRPRLYWTNIPNIEQPKDKGITLGDILLPSEVISAIPKLYLSDVAIERLRNINKRAKERGLGYKDCILTEKDKFLNLDANFFKGPDGKRGVIKQNGRLRMPHPIECERMQTVPDNYTDFVSRTQRYKLLGNGWTVDVAAHILKNMEF